MIYQDIWASLIRFSRTLNTDNSLGATIYDFEAHAITENLPPSHLIGPVSLAIAADPVDYASFTLGFSSFGEDTALFHHRKGIACLYEALRPEQRIPLYSLENTFQIGHLVLTEDTMVTPMTRAVARPFQSVSAVGRVTLD